MSLSAKRKFNAKIGSSAWSVASNFASRALTFLFTPIFIRLLSPEEYGIYSLFVSLMGIFTVFVTFEISGSVLYRGIAKFDENGECFLSCSLGALSALSLASLVIYIIFRERINGITSLNTRLTLYLFLQIFLNAALGIYFAEKRYAGDYKKVALINIAIGIVSPLLALSFILLGGGGESRIVAPIITYLFFCAPIIFGVAKRGKKFFCRKIWKFIFGITAPMLPHYLSLSLIAQSDKIIVAKRLGEGALGRYSAAYSVGFMLSLVTNGILLVLSPWTIKKQKSSDTNGVCSALLAVTKLICLATLIFISFLPEIFLLIANKEYYGALSSAFPVALSVVFLFLSSATQNCLIYYEKPIVITKNSLTAAVLCLLLNIFLIKRIGYIGGAVSTLISYALLFVLNKKSLAKLSKNTVTINTGIHFWLYVGSFAILIYLLRHSFSARIILLFAIILSYIPEIKKSARILA